MGRDIKLRINYRSDATYLLRILGSVEKDNRFPTEKKREVMRKLREIALEFMSIPSLGELEKSKG